MTGVYGSKAHAPVLFDFFIYKALTAKQKLRFVRINSKSYGWYDDKGSSKPDFSKQHKKLKALRRVEKENDYMSQD